MRASRGFTLAELMIVITILAVLMAAGLPSFAEFVRNQRVKTASFDLFSSLVLARNEAITRNASITVSPAAGVWTNGWTVTYTDTGGNVVPIRTQDALPSITISGPASVVYRGSGRLNGVVLPFQLSSSGDTVITRCISIDLGGRAHTKAAAC
ncbi:MAG: GspH/FimT family pseudopilin [Steroidobacteraceae bacterium]